MLFRRIIFSALALGLLTGLLMSLLQFFGVTPIIIAAEQYEVQAPASVHAEHHHGDGPVDGSTPSDWAPADGVERSLFTVVSNVLAAIGFSALLLALMAQFQLQGLALLSPIKGLWWGLAGFTVMFVAPSIGMAPEIPGLEAAAIEHRQAWWLMTVLATAVAIVLLCYGSRLFKILGASLLVLPHLIGAPHPDGPLFKHPDPQVIEALSVLHQQFIVASAFSSLVFWAVLGVACGWLLNRYVLKVGVNCG